MGGRALFKVAVIGVIVGPIATWIGCRTDGTDADRAGAGEEEREVVRRAPRRERVRVGSVRHRIHGRDRRDLPAAQEDREFLASIRVVTAGTNEPVGSAEVSMAGAAVITGSDGVALIDGLREGPTYGRIRARGFVARSFRYVASYPATSAQDEVPAWEFELRTGVVVPVKVRSVGGTPVAQAIVSLGVAGDPSREFDVVLTDASGRADAFMEARSPLLVRVSAPGYVDAVEFVRTTAVGDVHATLRVTVTHAASVRGVVREPSGRPAVGASARAFCANARGWFESSPTGSDGQFEIDGLVTGVSWTVQALGATDEAGRRRCSKTMSLGALESRTQLSDLYLNETWNGGHAPGSDEAVAGEGERGLLVVVVVNADGASMPGQKVIVRLANGAQIAEGATDVHGVFTRRVASGVLAIETGDATWTGVEVLPNDVVFRKLRSPPR